MASQINPDICRIVELANARICRGEVSDAGFARWAVCCESVHGVGDKDRGRPPHLTRTGFLDEPVSSWLRSRRMKVVSIAGALLPIRAWFVYTQQSGRLREGSRPR